jgi:hypothetical protein
MSKFEKGVQIVSAFLFFRKEIGKKVRIVMGGGVILKCHVV